MKPAFDSDSVGPVSSIKPESGRVAGHNHLTPTFFVSVGADRHFYFVNQQNCQDEDIFHFFGTSRTHCSAQSFITNQIAQLLDVYSVHVLICIFRYYKIFFQHLIELFSEVQKLGKTCLIDSNGSFDFEADPRVLEVSEGVMLDVKAVEKDWSDELISFPRDVVLKNLDYLLRVGKLYEVRTLIFPNRDRENEETVRYVAEHIRDGCFYKIIRYRPYGVRERYQKLLGEFETDADYAERFAALARDLGATKAYVI